MNGKKIGILAALLVLTAVLCFSLAFLDGEEERVLWYDSPEGTILLLSEKGTASLLLEEDTLEGTWRLEGENLTLHVRQEPITGVLSQGVLTLNLDGREIRFTNHTPGAGETEPALTEKTRPEETAAPEIREAGRDYYGWWTRKGTGESWHSGQDYAFWDVCASLETRQDGTGLLTLWDTDCQPGEIIGAVEVEVRGETLTVTGGSFVGCGLEPGDWILDPDDTTYGALPGLLSASGTAGEMDYLLFLRPWGMDWVDAQGPGLFFRDMRPAHYEDWYLLRKDGGMPDYFEGIVFPNQRN